MTMEILFLFLGLACGMLIASKSQKSDGIAERIQRVKVEPGDTVVISIPGSVPDSAAIALKRAWEDRFPDNKAVVFCDGVEIRSVLSRN